MGRRGKRQLELVDRGRGSWVLHGHLACNKEERKVSAVDYMNGWREQHTWEADPVVVGEVHQDGNRDGKRARHQACNSERLSDGSLDFVKWPQILCTLIAVVVLLQV